MQEIKFPFDVEKFFEKCVKNKNLPKNDFLKQAVLIKIVENFSNRKYSEQEVNKIIKKYFEDYTTLRRELINFKYMQRNPLEGKYWVVKRKLTKEDLDKNSLLGKHAKAYL